MSQYTPPRSRDAWGPIRGFVYQVDLIIERWLALSAGQAIELERGEDIDLVARALAGDEEAYRRLEQVKHRESAVTLRTAEAAGAVANAVEHRAANAGAVLLFRFTTNAAVGREKPSPMPGKRPAIEVWEELRSDQLTGPEAAAALTAIRGLLSDRPIPDDFNEDTWAAFQAFLKGADDAALLDLVRAFEWSTRATRAEDMERGLKATLLRLGHAPDARGAELVYQRLFLRVFKLLSTPGLKQLTPEDLAADVAAGALDPAERQLMDAVRGRVDELERRVDRVQRQLADHATAVNVRLDELAAAQGIRAAVDYTTQAIDLAAPPSVARLTRRSETVTRLNELLASHVWLALSGAPGTGVTELAKLIRDARGGAAPWIELAGLTRDQAALRLDTAAASCGPPRAAAARSRRAEYDKLCASVAPPAAGAGVIVLNDAPDLDGRDPLSVRLIDLFAACRDAGVRLLTTSTKPLPSRLRDLVSDQHLACEPAPPLSDAEAAELLAAHGAPAESLPTRLVQVINAQAGGHTTLVAAAARHLARAGWRVTEETASALLQGQYAAELRPETTARLTEEVADADARQLLYRLNLTFGPFDADDVAALGAIHPPVPHALERLDQLVDVCVQRAADQKLRVSPLFRALGARDVPATTAAACHVRLAESIVRRDRISPYDAAGAFGHFVAGGELDRAGVLLLRALSALDDLDAPFDDALLASVYDHVPLPDGMDLGIRILVRAHQVRLCHKLGRNTTHALAELDRLLGAATDTEAWAVLGAGIVTEPYFAEHDLPRANRYLLAAIEALPKVRAAMAGHWQPPGFDPELLFWPNALNVSTAAEMDDWMSAVGRLTPDQRQRLFTQKLAEGGSLYLSERLWLAELGKPAAARDWPAIDRALERLGEWARAGGTLLLEAAAARVRIVIRAEQMRDLDGAIAFAERTIPQVASDARARYLVRDAVGTQLVLRGRPSDGAAWLGTALQEAGNSYPAQRIVTLLYSARAASETGDAAGAVRHARAAVDVASSAGAEVGDVLVARALGELGVALWLAEGVVPAFEPLDRAFDRLWASRHQDDTDDWRGAMVAFSHIGGYLAAVASGGKPPIDDDGESRPAPRVGLMTSAGAGLAGVYEPTKAPALFGTLAVYADAVGAEAKAAERALQGLDAARAGNSIITVSMLGVTHLPYLTLADRPAEVIDTAMEAAAALSALRGLRAAGASPFAVDRTVEQILGPKPSPEWMQAEREAQLMGLLPLALRLATVSVEDPARAAALAAEAAAACRTVGRSASDPASWEEGAAILDTTFVTRSAGRELAQFARRLQMAGKPALGAMAFLGASLQDDTPLKSAAQIHVHVLADAARRLGADGPVGASYLRVAVPFAVAYWSRVVRTQRFQFTPPSLTERQLDDAKAVPGPRRAQAVLSAVLNGLGVPPPSDEADWLGAR